MEKEEAEQILLRYGSNQATEEEKALVEQWMLRGLDQQLDIADEQLLQDLISTRRRLGLSAYAGTRKNALWKSLATAAVLLLIAAAGVLLYPQKQEVISAKAMAGRDKDAASNRAILKLSDGREVELDQNVGDIVDQSGAVIENDSTGHLVYSSDLQSNSADGTISYNTITTPKGGHYKLVLPDGSRVWLNAGSSLRFPLAFGSERKVELLGEGYFEIEKSRKKFSVATGNTVVEVLGTHFNVKNYVNERRGKITLLEGSVQIRQGTKALKIRPGEQAIVGSEGNGNEDIVVEPKADMEVVNAWREGMFQFHNTDLKNIMLELERWYDVDVDLANIPKRKFNGSISRNVKLSEVLAMIEITSGLHFKIEGRSVRMR